MPADSLFGSDALPVTRIDRSVGFEEYFDYASNFFEAKPFGPRSDAAFSTRTSWFTDRVMIGIETTGPVVSKRAKTHTQGSEHLISIERYWSGQERGIVGEETAETVLGAITIEDQEQPFEYVSSGVSCECVYAQKSEIGYDPDRHSAKMNIPADTAIGKLVHASMDELYQSAIFHGEFVSESALEEFFACLKIALGTHPQREDVRAHARAALYKLICRYIEDNLAEPDIGTRSILKNFGLSRASLYRMFEPQGGVRTYIMERRLTRAMLDISDHKIERGVFRRVAERWGFSTQPNFNRSIERAFGSSPSRLFPSNYSVQPVEKASWRSAGHSGASA